jgi:hypothetical protein
MGTNWVLSFVERTALLRVLDIFFTALLCCQAYLYATFLSRESNLRIICLSELIDKNTTLREGSTGLTVDSRPRRF